MSVFGTSTLALALVYSVIGGHALMLARGRRSDRVVWSFGMVCLSMAAYSLQSTLMSEAKTVGQARFAQDGELVSAAFAVAFHLDFCRELRGSHDRPTLWFACALPAMTTVLAALGLLSEPTAASLRLGSSMALADRPDPMLAKLGVYGVAVELSLLFGVALAVYLAYSGEGRQQLRPTVAAPSLLLVAVSHDIDCRTGSSRPPGQHRDRKRPGARDHHLDSSATAPENARDDGACRQPRPTSGATMMLSPLAAALFSASALCLAQGLFHQLGHRGRRRSAAQRAFSVSLYAMAFQCFGTGLLTDATDLSAGMQAQTIQFLGQAVALAAFMDFQQRTTVNECGAAQVAGRWSTIGGRPIAPGFECALGLAASRPRVGRCSVPRAR